MKLMNYFVIPICIFCVILCCQSISNKELNGRVILKGNYSAHKLNHKLSAKGERDLNCLNIWINHDKLYSKSCTENGGYS